MDHKAHPAQNMAIEEVFRHQMGGVRYLGRLGSAKLPAASLRLEIEGNFKWLKIHAWKVFNSFQKMTV